MYEDIVMSKENLMLENDIFLMVAILSNIFWRNRQNTGKWSKWKGTFQFELEDAGLLFEYMGFAEQDLKSPIGWRPTYQLMQIISARVLKHKPQRWSGGDGETVDNVRDVVFGYAKSQRGCVGLEFLDELGLLQGDAFAQGYHFSDHCRSN